MIDMKTADQEQLTLTIPRNRQDLIDRMWYYDQSKITEYCQVNEDEYGKTYFYRHNGTIILYRWYLEVVVRTIVQVGKNSQGEATV